MQKKEMNPHPHLCSNRESNLSLPPPLCSIWALGRWESPILWWWWSFPLLSLFFELLMSLETPSQTHPEIMFTISLGNHSAPLNWHKINHPTSFGVRLDLCCAKLLKFWDFLAIAARVSYTKQCKMMCAQALLSADPPSPLLHLWRHLSLHSAGSPITPVVITDDCLDNRWHVPRRGAGRLVWQCTCLQS